MKSKKAALELETVIKFIIALVIIAVLILLIYKYGGSIISGVKGISTNVLDLLKSSPLKINK